MDFKKTLNITNLPLKRCILLRFGLLFSLIEPAHDIMVLIAYASREAQINHFRCAVSPEHSLLALHKVVMLTKSYNKR